MYFESERESKHCSFVADVLADSSHYLSLKKKVSPLIWATASKTIASLQMSMGVTGPWVGGKGLSVGTPVDERLARALSKLILFHAKILELILAKLGRREPTSHRRAPGCLGCHREKVWSLWWRCKRGPSMLRGPGSAPNQGHVQTHGLPPGTNCSLQNTDKVIALLYLV